MSAFISRLKTLIGSAESLENMLPNITPQLDDWGEIERLTAQLAEVASHIYRNVESSKQSRNKQVVEEAEAMKKQAKPYQDSLANNLPRAPIFRRNMIIIFEGPKESPFNNSTAERRRKEVTRRRCDVLRSLNTDGLILWAISYAPTSWAGGKLSWAVFDELVGDIEPSERQVFPSDLVETLMMILERDLSGNTEYERFLGGRYSWRCMKSITKPR